jgi:uncharacterized membrane protein
MDAKTAKTFLLIAILTYVALYGYLGFARHFHFNSHLFDLGIQDQVVWNTSQGTLYRSSVEVDNYLGDHFQPLIAVLAVFYWVYPSVY